MGMPLNIAADAAAEIGRWRDYLGAERRMSPKTLEAYERDVGQFLRFMADHLGGPPSLKTLAKITPADVRAFMAARRSGGAGNRTLMRSLAGARSFARFLERDGKGKVGALAAIRAPKLGRTLPKPLTALSAKQMTDIDLRAGEDRETWILVRDAAVLALLYGCGLRISEALGLKRGDANGKDTLTVLGKGNKTRMVPVLPIVTKAIDDYIKLCPYDLPPDGPLFVGARGGPLSPRIVQLAMATFTRRTRPARDGDTARAAALLRDASAGARRRFALDPGIARPRLAVDDPDLYGRRHGAPARGLCERPSARLNAFTSPRQPGG